MSDTTPAARPTWAERLAAARERSNAPRVEAPRPYTDQEFAQVIAPERPKPGGSLLASAARITESTVKSSAFRKTTHQSWQDDGWAMFDLLGELRFALMTIAQRSAKARMFIGTLQDDPNEQPVPTEDPKMIALLDSIGDGHVGMSQLIQRLVLNLSVAGDGWLVGIPGELVEAARKGGGDQDDNSTYAVPTKVDRTPREPGVPIGTEGDSSQQTMDDLVWKMLSIDEVQFQQGNAVRFKLGPADSESVTCSPDDVYMVRVWRSHPRHWWDADSPVRSSLPVLRELVGLTMHISAQIDSRLAGAGVFIVPESASLAMKRQLGLADDDPRDPFVESLIDSMMKPIEDRSNAAAIVQDDPIKSAALDLIRANPSLMVTPGLKVIVEQLTAMMHGQDIPDMPQQAQAQAEADQAEDTNPASSGDPTATGPTPAKNAGSIPTGHPLEKPMETNPAAGMAVVASPFADPYSGRDFREQPQGVAVFSNQQTFGLLRPKTEEAPLADGVYTAAPVRGSLSRALAAAELSEDGIVDLTGLE